MAEDLGFGHAQDLACLLLALRHSLDAAPVDLGEVAGVINDEGHTHGHHPPRLTAGPVEPLLDAGHIEQCNDLQHQRRAPDDPDHQAGQPPQGRKAAHGTEADNQAQGQCPDQGDEKQLKGLEKSAVQGRQHGPECAGGKKFNHGIVLSRSVW